MAEHELQQVVDKMDDIRSLALPGTVTLAMLASSVRGICDNIIVLAKYIMKRETGSGTQRQGDDGHKNPESWGFGSVSDPKYKEEQRAETERYRRMMDRAGEAGENRSGLCTVREAIQMILDNPGKAPYEYCMEMACPVGEKKVNVEIIITHIDGKRKMMDCVDAMTLVNKEREYLAKLVEEYEIWGFNPADSIALDIRGRIENNIQPADDMITDENNVGAFGTGRVLGKPKLDEEQIMRYHRMLDKVGPVHQFIVPPSDGRHVILLMTNHVFDYRVVGKYDHELKEWRISNYDGFFTIPIMGVGCEVTGWQELP